MPRWARFGLMSRRRLLLLIAALAPLGAGAAPALPQDLVVQVCDDAAEWPPYSFYERQHGPERKTERVVGAAVDVLDRILGAAGLRYQLVLLPWKRCQLGIEAGTYHLALNASYSDERARTYWLTRPYYSLHSNYYYSRRTHPAGLTLTSVRDLRRLRVCGLNGYNYSTYGLGHGQIDLTSTSHAQALRKLQRDRCDVFIEKREIVEGLALIDAAVATELRDPQLASAMLPGVAPTPFHMIVTRAEPWGQALTALIDAGISRLADSGELSALLP